MARIAYTATFPAAQSGAEVTANHPIYLDAETPRQVAHAELNESKSVTVYSDATLITLSCNGEDLDLTSGSPTGSGDEPATPGPSGSFPTPTTGDAQKSLLVNNTEDGYFLGGFWDVSAFSPVTGESASGLNESGDGHRNIATCTGRVKLDAAGSWGPFSLSLFGMKMTFASLELRSADDSEYMALEQSPDITESGDIPWAGGVTNSRGTDLAFASGAITSTAGGLFDYTLVLNFQHVIA